jgi:hypothetical protein
MSLTDGSAPLTREELAWELVEIFDELSVEHINEMLAKNVPLDTLSFMARYAEEFADGNEIADPARKRIPNLLLLGYLLRIVEERLLGDDGEA